MPSAAEINDAYLLLISQATSQLPLVGGFVTLLVTSLWPTSGQNSLLDEAKDYIDSRISQLIDQTEAASLRKRIDELKNGMAMLVDPAGSPGMRKSVMKDLLIDTKKIRTEFVNAKATTATITYIIAFGVIRLGLLRQQCDHYKEIWGDESDNPGQLREDLHEEVYNFLGLISLARGDIMKLRRNCISLHEDPGNPIGNNYNHIITVTDTFTGYSKQYHEQSTMFTERHERPQAEADQNNLLAECDTTFAAQLDETFASTRYWNCFDTITGGTNYKPPLRPVYNYNALGNGIDSATQGFDDKQWCESYSAPIPITRVVLHAGDWIDGIEVFYGGRSSGLHGRAGGTALTLDLADGEVIMEMGGNIGDYVVAFWIKTNFGHKIGGQGPPGTKDNFYLTYGAPNPVQPYHTRVAYFLGRYGSTRVDQLRVGWASYQP